MASQTSPEKVIIIGAGLSGLALGQRLKNASPPVPFHIHERDLSTAFRSQGYRIRISPAGAAALERLLPDHLWDAFQRTCAAVAPGMGSRLDARSGEVPQSTAPTPGGRAGPPPEMMKGKSYNADRAVLRNVLMEGLEDHISFGKQFIHYERQSAGGVEVDFADGSKSHGSILIGADGTRSVVRKQVLPGLSILDPEGRAVFGKTYLSPELKAQLPRELTNGMTMVIHKGDERIKMLCDTMHFADDLDAKRRQAYQVPADYIYWVLCFRKDACPVDAAKLLHYTHEDAISLSLKFAEHWDDSLRVLFEEQDRQSPSTLSFTICRPEDFIAQWKATEEIGSGNNNTNLVRGPVTLLGDAAHPMTPVGGVGANTAFQEASDLANVLIQMFNGEEKMDVSDAIHTYQGLMVERGAEMINNSISGAGHFFAMRPIEELEAAKQ